MFENRLKKLKKDREKWSKKENIFCYRVYSEDIPQIPVILDFYPNGLVLFDKSSLRHQTEEEKEQRFFENPGDCCIDLSECSNLFKKSTKNKKDKEHIYHSREKVLPTGFLNQIYSSK